LQNGSLLQQLTDSVSGLSAVGEPLLGLVGIDVDNAGLLGGIVVADLLDEAAIAGKAAVGNNNAVEGSFLGAHAAQTNLNHCKFLQILVYGPCGANFILYIPWAVKPCGSYLNLISGQNL